MKAAYFTLSLLLLAGCTPSPREQARQAVTKYLQRTLADPGSYEPGGFEVQALSRADSAAIATSQLRTQLVRNDSSMLAANALAGGERQAQQLLADNKVLMASLKQLQQVRDTARVGWRVTHYYRARNAANALIKQEQTFAVYPHERVYPIAE